MLISFVWYQSIELTLAALLEPVRRPLGLTAAALPPPGNGR
jgi:hypothetical protein